MGQGHSTQKLQDTGQITVDPNVNNILAIDGYGLLKQLGEGSYGKVRMVVQKRSGNFYALKYVDKRHQPVVLKTIVEERNILSKLQHPFICNLKYAFQDEGFYCLVLDLGTGGDLRHHITLYSFEEATVRHWIAELACAIEYLHENMIVHRDIKPENIMLDGLGHVKLADFNVARQITEETPLITGVSGTFSYLAPEMHQGVPYGQEVDWWALGVVFFECIYSVVPFRVKIRTAMLPLITTVGLQFPKTNPPVSDACKIAIKMLLQVRPSDRVSSAKSLFASKFFRGMDRKRLELTYCLGNTSSLTQTQDCVPIYCPSEKKLLKSVHKDCCVQRDVLKGEFAMWVKKKARQDAEKRKRQKAILAASKKAHSGSNTRQSKKSDSAKEVQVRILHQDSPHDKSTKKPCSRNSDYFTFCKLRKLLSRYNKQSNDKTTPSKTGNAAKNKPKPQSKQASTMGSGGSVKRLAIIKAKYDLEQKFFPFNHEDQKLECNFGTELATTTSSTGSFTVGPTTEVSESNEDANIAATNKINLSIKPAETQSETTMGSGIGDISSMFKKSHKNPSSRSSSLEKISTLRSKRKLTTGDKPGLPPGVLALGQKGRSRLVK